MGAELNSADSPPDEIDPSWWAEAFAHSTEEDDDWQAPEIVSRHIARLAEAAPEGTLQRDVLVALATATSAMLEPEDWGEPFKPMMVMGGMRSALPSDLAEEQFRLLARALPTIEQPALIARVADVVWTFHDRANSQLLGVAIDAYLDVPLEWDAWIRRGADAWRRAIELTRRRGKGEAGRLDRAAAALRQRILSGSVADGFMIADLSDLLRVTVRLDTASSSELAVQLAALAASAADAGNLRLSRHLERAAEKWFRSAGDTQAANDSIERVARLYLREADERIAQGDEGSAMAAGIFLEKAIGTFRTLPRSFRTARGIDAELADLRNRLGDNREATLEAMHRISTDPIDLTDAVTDTRKRLSGLSKFDALVHLAASWPLADADKERATAEELAAGSIRHLFGAATYAADGRKVAASDGGLDGNGEAIEADLARNTAMRRGVIAAAYIVPGLEIVAFEHRFDLGYLERLCLESIWVPTGHEELWARGLRHGLNGDFPSAVAMLVPQIEQALRQALKSQGAHTLFVDDATGVESEKSLPALLAMPECVETLGLDLQHELVTLLIQQQGDNLRHNTAHGLLNDAQAWSAGAAYAWWLCLRLVVVPVWRMRADAAVSASPEDEADSPDESEHEDPPPTA